MKDEEIVHEQIGEGGMGTVEVKAQPSGAEVSSASQSERSACEVLAAKHVPHRPGISRTIGLRAGTDVAFIRSRTLEGSTP